MPLTANTPNGVIYSWTLNESDRKNDYYKCPFCHTEMRLVIPEIRITHFRHMVNNLCPLNDTIKQLECKRFLHNRIPNSQVEKVIGDKIGDIVIGKTVIITQYKPLHDIEQLISDWNDRGYKVTIISTRLPKAHDNYNNVYRVPKWLTEIHKIFNCIYIFGNNKLYHVTLERVYGTSTLCLINRNQIKDIYPIAKKTITILADKSWSK